MNDHPNLEVMSGTRASLPAKISLSGEGDGLGIWWADPGAPPPRFSRVMLYGACQGRVLLAKDYRGQAEVFGFFGRLMELSGGTFALESLDILANDSGGVFVDRATAARNGRKLDVRLLLQVIIKDGQIVEGFDCIHQEHLWDAFWA